MEFMFLKPWDSKEGTAIILCAGQLVQIAFRDKEPALLRIAGKNKPGAGANWSSSLSNELQDLFS